MGGVCLDCEDDRLSKVDYSSLESIVHNIGWNEAALQRYYAGFWMKCDACKKIFIIHENKPHSCPYCEARKRYEKERGIL